jgi:hypothetical protein
MNTATNAEKILPGFRMLAKSANLPAQIAQVASVP